MSADDNLAARGASISRRENKSALIVGVNNSSRVVPYRSALKYAEKDAEDMAYLLKQPECGFTLLAPCIIGEKATTSSIKKGMMNLSLKKTGYDFLLFYFAGHAVPINNDIYFVTYDFQEDTIEDTIKVDPDFYLSMSWLWKVLYQSTGAGRVLIILDCCYSGNMVEAKDDHFKIDLRKLLQEWDTGVNNKTSYNSLRLILTATGYNTQAQELDGHGLMTGLLLKALRGEVDDVLDKEGHVDIRVLHRYLQEEMPTEQRPDLSGKFGPYNCILASHPHRSERLRRQAKENELRNKVERDILSELRLHAETQHNQPFDFSVCHGASFADLDLEKVTEFLKQKRVQRESAFYPGASEENQFLQFGFLQKSSPTYGALICFGQNPPNWVSGAMTRCVDWESSPELDHMKDSREYGGALLRQYELSRDFLRKRLRLSRVIDREGSIEEWEIPFRVLDEALANALVHREYANRTDPVRIEVFDDRIEISSPGTLPSPMTEQLLRTKHKSFPRNPQIAGIFYLHGYIEKFGTGIQRMQRFMSDAGLPEPEFIFGEDKTITVVLYRPKQASEDQRRQSLDDSVQAIARTKYLENVYRRYSSVILPLGPAEGFSLQAIFQPLTLRRNPSSVEDLTHEERRTFFGEPKYSNMDPHQASLKPDSYQSFDQVRQAIPAMAAEEIDDALKKSSMRRIVILGGPGTGKTTLLKYLIIDHARKGLVDPTTSVPIFLSLADFVHSEKTLQRYLFDLVEDMGVESAYANILWKEIEKGRAFICLDGLDEVNPQHRAQVIELINTWAADSSSTWIIGSRFSEYKSGQFKRAHFTEWELLPMSHMQRLGLAERLLPSLQLLLPASREASWTPVTFVDHLEHDPRAAALGETPLLFSLAAMIFGRTGALPFSQVELYQNVIDAILQGREQDPAQREMLRGVLAMLALELYHQDKRRTFALSFLLRFLPKIRKEQDENWDTEKMAHRIVNSGLLEVVAKETYSFLHQTFQEYLASVSIILFPRVKAEQEIIWLIEHLKEPIYRSIIVEFAYLAHQHEPTLENYLYQALLVRLGSSKLEILTAQREGHMMAGSAVSTVVWGIDEVLQSLVDHWGPRLCATLESGSPDRPEDGEVASTIASVFERNPRQFAVSALIDGMHKYRKRGRFIGALGKIGSEQAKNALLTFTEEQIAYPTDRYVFKYLASALGEACIEEAIPLLQTIRNGSEFDDEARNEADHSLRLLGKEKDFEENRRYPLDAIRTALELEDEEGRPSDWTRVAAIATWLQNNGLQDPPVQTHLTEIVSALERALHHVHDGARKPVVLALGELGNFQTFDILAKQLVEHFEPSYDVAIVMLSSLARLAERNQIDPKMHESTGETISSIRLTYPILEKEVSSAGIRIQECLDKESAKSKERF